MLVRRVADAVNEGLLLVRALFLPSGLPCAACLDSVAVGWRNSGTSPPRACVTVGRTKRSRALTLQWQPGAEVGAHSRRAGGGLGSIWQWVRRPDRT